MKTNEHDLGMYMEFLQACFKADAPSVYEVIGERIDIENGTEFKSLEDGEMILVDRNRLPDPDDDLDLFVVKNKHTGEILVTCQREVNVKIKEFRAEGINWMNSHDYLGQVASTYRGKINHAELTINQWKKGKIKLEYLKKVKKKYTQN